jgi:transposase
MCETPAKRIASIILITVRVKNTHITELTGLCDRSVRSLIKAIESGDTDDLLTVSGGGRKRKLTEVEASVLEEINNNNYHSRQQIADMIFDKFGVKVSLPAVGRLLKKTALST